MSIETEETVFGETVDDGSSELLIRLEEMLFAALGGGGSQDQPAQYGDSTKMEAAHREGQLQLLNTAKAQARAIAKYVEGFVTARED